MGGALTPLGICLKLVAATMRTSNMLAPVSSTDYYQLNVLKAREKVEGDGGGGDGLRGKLPRGWQWRR